jgi:hypothetical protein
MTARGRAGRLLLGAALLGGAVLCASLRTRRPGESHPTRATPGAAVVDPARAARPSRAALAELLATASRAHPPEQAHARPVDGRPHPITPDHLRLYRDADLLRAADAAIRAGRFDDARGLLAQHRRELSGMSAREEEGLLLLADCAERRSAHSVARVQRFYDEHTDSTLRRRLRRGCLEAGSEQRTGSQ